MAQIFINANRSAGTINKNIYGHFAEHLGRCIYGGLANADGTPRADVIEALKGIDVPVLRWPGGCFADTYHWRDGVGPKAQRKTIVNTNWGGVTENNAFGTHEFLEVCRQLGCDPYISGNVGSGTVQEFSDWVEYCNMPGVSPMADLRRQNGGDAPFNVQYWGVGNENWGCGGNMRPEHYADLCRQYATFLRSYDNDAPLYKIACGPSNDDYRWTKVVAEQAGRYIDALSLHYYTLTLKDGDWQQKGSATEFSRCELYEALRQAMRMEEMVENHGRIMRRVCPEKKLGLVVDEWGTWFDVEPGTNPGFLYQQNTMRDALVAALTLNIFNNHCDTVVMANIAQIANVLQSMVLTEGDKLLLTPTYHVFKMYKAHQNARQLETYAETRLLDHEADGLPDVGVVVSGCGVGRADVVVVAGGQTLTAGEDFPAGVYDITVVSGYGAPDVTVYDESGSEIGYLYPWISDSSEPERTYRNAVLPEGAVFANEDEDLELQLVPSETIASEDYLRYYT